MYSEFGIREIRYVNCRVALDDEIAICFLSNLVQKSIVPCAEFSHRLMLVWQYLGGSFHSLSPPTTPPSYLQMPSLIPRPISYCSELFKLTPCCSLVGTLFQLSWNSVPIQLEHHSGWYGTAVQNIYNTAVNVIMHHQGLESAFSELWKCEWRDG